MNAVPLDALKSGKNTITVSVDAAAHPEIGLFFDAQIEAQKKTLGAAR